MLFLHCGEYLVEKNNSIFIVTRKEICSLEMDFDVMGEPCHSPLLGVKDPSFQVVDTYLRDVLCIYIVEFIKEMYMGTCCSI